jgi:queuine tRNA-ribosyltransferase
MRLAGIDLRSGRLNFPVFLPDATYGVVRSIDSQDLHNCGIMGLVMNTFHLMQHPGSSTIQSLGGLHRMSGWSKPIVTDSGGFQAYSLIRQNPKSGSLSENGITFFPEGSTRKYLLTPEKTVQLQLAYGSDIVICLDDCTHVDNEYAAQVESVERTIVWAKRCKKEFLKVTAQKNLTGNNLPLIFAVVQGGGYRDLRKKCADALLEIGFDGFGFGGWPLDKDNNLLTDIIGFSRESIPQQFPMHALGVGHPENILNCYGLGYDIFDSAMPTRDARHARLYKFNNPESDAHSGLTGKWLSYYYVSDEQHIRSDKPISEFCDCPCCSQYSRGYLHHLFKQGDTLFYRLATIHNLRFMTQLTDRIRENRSNEG